MMSSCSASRCSGPTEPYDSGSRCQFFPEENPRLTAGALENDVVVNDSGAFGSNLPTAAVEHSGNYESPDAVPPSSSSHKTVPTSNSKSTPILPELAVTVGAHPTTKGVACEADSSQRNHESGESGDGNRFEDCAEDVQELENLSGATEMQSCRATHDPPGAPDVSGLQEHFEDIVGEFFDNPRPVEERDNLAGTFALAATGDPFCPTERSKSPGEKMYDQDQESLPSHKNGFLSVGETAASIDAEFLRRLADRRNLLQDGPPFRNAVALLRWRLDMETVYRDRLRAGLLTLAELGSLRYVAEKESEPPSLWMIVRNEYLRLWHVNYNRIKQDWDQRGIASLDEKRALEKQNADNFKAKSTSKKKDDGKNQASIRWWIHKVTAQTKHRDFWMTSVNEDAEWSLAVQSCDTTVPRLIVLSKGADFPCSCAVCRNHGLTSGNFTSAVGKSPAVTSGSKNSSSARGILLGAASGSLTDPTSIPAGAIAAATGSGARDENLLVDYSVFCRDIKRKQGGNIAASPNTRRAKVPRF